MLTLIAIGFVIRWLVQLDRSVWENLRHLHPLWLLGSIVVFQVWFLMRFAAWEMIVKRHGSESQRHQTLRYWTLSELARYVPGNLWSFAAKYRSSVTAGASKAAAVQALAIEALSQLFGAGLIAAIFFDARRLWWVAMLIVLFSPVFISFTLSVLTRWKKWEQVPKITIVESLGLLVWYSLVWTVFGLATAMIYRSFPGALHVSWTWLFGVNVGAWLIGYLSLITPMGLGVREVAFVRLTTGMLPNAAASLVALITRLWFVLSELVFLVLVIGWSTVKNRSAKV